MTARIILIAAVAAAMCACATPMTSDRASLQSAVYMVGDNAPLVRANTNPGAMENEGEFSVVKRIYWFFAGR